MIARLLLADHPQETRFFAFLGVFGIVLAAIYWVVSYEVAGTILLAAFGLACLVAGVRLMIARPAAMARRATRGEAGAASITGPDQGEGTGGGTDGVDRPFLDESGRLPGDTLAPLAIGLGVALALTAVVFGPWLLVAGIVPLGWGAGQWFAGARDELDATVAADPRESAERR